MDIGVHMSLSVLVSSVCMPSSGIVGSYGSFMFAFMLKQLTAVWKYNRHIVNINAFVVYMLICFDMHLHQWKHPHNLHSECFYDHQESPYAPENPPPFPPSPHPQEATIFSITIEISWHFIRFIYMKLYSM